jgi:hypothetical protein
VTVFGKDHRDRDELTMPQDVRATDVRHELNAVKMREVASARPAPRIPDFFIAGAPRTGTTALFEHLRRHPQIFVPRRKETMFFGADILNDRRMSLDEYVALFADAGDVVRVGEVSTTYLFSRTAASEIREFNPEARIIIPLRDPITVMQAVHSLLVWTGFEPIHNFAAALEAQERERTGQDPPTRRQLPYYRDMVDFADHVDRYFDTFGRERVHVVVFDDWVADTPRVYRQTLEFLEVDPSFVPNLEVVNPNRRVRSERLHDLVVRRYAFVPARVRPRMRNLLITLTTREAPREPLDPALLASLRVEFAPKIERLAKLIDRDLSAWIRGSAAPAAVEA